MGEGKSPPSRDETKRFFFVFFFATSLQHIFILFSVAICENTIFAKFRENIFMLTLLLPHPQVQYNESIILLMRYNLLLSIFFGLLGMWGGGGVREGGEGEYSVSI